MKQPCRITHFTFTSLHFLSGTLRRTDVSVGIVKSTSYEIEKDAGRKFLLATDDSPSAKVAFALLVTKLVHAGKDTVCVYMNTPDTGALLAKYKVECDKIGVACELHANHDHTTDVSDDVLRFAFENSVDVLMLGTNGFTGQALGLVSDKCANAARCTTVVVKDPRQN